MTFAVFEMLTVKMISLQAPLVNAESVQKIKVEVQGMSFKLIEERKVMFKPYYPSTFIQTDKPIYRPGQTGEMKNFSTLVHKSPITVLSLASCNFVRNLV